MMPTCDGERDVEVGPDKNLTGKYEEKWYAVIQHANRPV